MPYVTSFERIAKKEGLGEGRIEGLRASILTVAKLRLTTLPEAFTERLALVNDETRLNQVLTLVTRSASLEELEQGLDALGI